MNGYAMAPLSSSCHGYSAMHMNETGRARIRSRFIRGKHWLITVTVRSLATDDETTGTLI
jgi:hypothetical protein